MSASADAMILASYERWCARRLDAAAHQTLKQERLAMPLWNEIEGLGLPGLLVDYEGELEHPTRTALAVAVLTGYHCVPLPVAENMAARAALRAADLEAPEGLLALAVAPALAVRLAGASPALQGRVRVPWARTATHLVLAVAGDTGETLVVVPTEAAGVRLEPGCNAAGEPRDLVSFEAAQPVGFGALPGIVERAALESARFRAALLAGAAESALDLSVDYVNARSQFGKPLGKFQAVQQSLARFAGEVSGALSACALAFSRSVPDWRTVAIAKMRAGVAASVGCDAAHQAHGAIGVTAEYPLHRRTQRLWSWRAEDGTGATWARRLGEDFIGRGPADLWPAITRLRR